MNLSCSKCEFVATSYYILKKHTDKNHNNVVHKCEKCNKQLASVASLSKHKVVCTGLCSLQCKYCYAFLSSRLTKCRHIKICPCKPDEDDYDDIM